MARPVKDTAEYFPHDADASDGKTLTILEAQYGNNGFAVWFKLLERLTKSPKHFYDCRNASNWEYFVAKCHLDGVSVAEILQKLADLDAIDKELWAKKVIWCQNLVDRFSEVYRKRGRALPQKPIIDNRNDVTAPVSATETTPVTNMSATEIQQSKVEQSKVNKSKVEKNITATETIYAVYENNIGMLNPIMADKLKDAEKEYSSLWVTDAIKEAVKYNKRNWAYIQAILERWKNDGHINGEIWKHTKEIIPTNSTDPETEELRASIGKPL